MADNPAGAATAPTESEGTPAPDAQTEPVTQAQGDLGPKGVQALERERAARKAVEARLKELEPLAEELQKLRDAEKSEVEKLGDKLAREVEHRQRVEAENIRLRVAMDNGLTSDQANRLVGTTQEELEADAKEFLKMLRPAEPEEEPQPGSVQQTPQPRLKSGVPAGLPLNGDPLTAALERKLGISR